MATRYCRALSALGAVVVALGLCACAGDNGGRRITLSSFETAPHHSGQFARDQSAKLGKGVNIGNALEATPDESGWGNPIDLRWFKLIREAGFEHVRIPIRWSLASRTALSPPYEIAPAFFGRVDEVVQAALDNHLMVVIDVHHYNEPGHDLFANPDQEAPRFLAMWRQIAAHFKDRSTDIIFEPLNEPNSELTPEKWNALAQAAVKEIRAIDSRHTIVIDCALWGTVDGLAQLALPSDDNLIGSFHFYEPMQFTHQGASWVSPLLPAGVLWPNRAPFPTNKVVPAADVASSWFGSWYAQYNDQSSPYPGDPADIARRLEVVQAWGTANDCPVYLGEFGAFGGNEPANHDSRIRWTRYVAEQARSLGFSYAYWELSAGFGVFDKETGKFRGDLLRAILG